MCERRAHSHKSKWNRNRKREKEARPDNTNSRAKKAACWICHQFVSTSHNSLGSAQYGSWGMKHNYQRGILCHCALSLSLSFGVRNAAFIPTAYFHWWWWIGAERERGKTLSIKSRAKSCKTLVGDMQTVRPERWWKRPLSLSQRFWPPIKKRETRECRLFHQQPLALLNFMCAGRHDLMMLPSPHTAAPVIKNSSQKLAKKTMVHDVNTLCHFSAALEWLSGWPYLTFRA